MDRTRTPFTKSVGGFAFASTVTEAAAASRKSKGAWIDAGSLPDGSHGVGCTKPAVDIFGIEAPVLLTFCAAGGLCEISYAFEGSLADRPAQIRQVLTTLEEKYGKAGRSEGLDGPDGLASACSQSARPR